MKPGTPFLLLGAGCLVAGVDRLRFPQTPFLLQFILLSAAVSFFGVALAYFRRWPGLLGKTRQGRLLSSSYFLFWPYHLLNFVSLWVYRLLFREPPWHEIAPGIYLGRRLLPGEKPPAARTVVDLTAEFSEPDRVRRDRHYHCIPLLDSTAPSPGELEFALDWIEKAPEGGVFIHCALGHGRSATVVAAHLIASGRASDPAAAVALLRQRRPLVRLLPGQFNALVSYCHDRRNLRRRQ
jgi:hypothetical protein